MKIIINKTDKTVIFAEESLSLDENGARGNGWGSNLYTTENCALLDVEALPENYCGGLWTYDGSFSAKPDLDAWVAERDAKEAARYGVKRAAEYAPVGDQLDALWKLVDALRAAGTVLPADTEAALNKVLAVKQKYPKPKA